MNQQIPSFLNSFTKLNKVLILNVDMRYTPEYTPIIVEQFKHKFGLSQNGYNSYTSSQEEHDFTFNVFQCYLPSDNEYFKFARYLEVVLKDFISKGKQMFIANHTQAYSLEDIPLIANVYNSVKIHFQNKPDLLKLLQLYTHGGRRDMITYYLDFLYDSRSEYKSRDEETFEYQGTEVMPAPFLICHGFDKLCTLEEFKPKKEVSHEPSSGPI